MVVGEGYWKCLTSMVVTGCTKLPLPFYTQTSRPAVEKHYESQTRTKYVDAFCFSLIGSPFYHNAQVLNDVNCPYSAAFLPVRIADCREATQLVVAEIITGAKYLFIVFYVNLPTAGFRAW